MKIIRFKQMGSLSRVPYLDYFSNRFWIEPGTIALQVGDVVHRPPVGDIFENVLDPGDNGPKDVVALIMEDGTGAWAVCAPGGWHPWIEEL